MGADRFGDGGYGGGRDANQVGGRTKAFFVRRTGIGAVVIHGCVPMRNTERGSNPSESIEALVCSRLLRDGEGGTGAAMTKVAKVVREFREWTLIDRSPSQELTQRHVTI
jgi:hypothetical protein